MHGRTTSVHLSLRSALQGEDLASLKQGAVLKKGVWIAYPLPGGRVYANPITYLSEGRQFIYHRSRERALQFRAAPDSQARRRRVSRAEPAYVVERAPGAFLPRRKFRSFRPRESWP